METFNRLLAPLVYFLMIVGALNWGIFGLTGGDTNVLEDIFTTGTVLDIVYIAIGVAGLMLIPRLLEELHIGAGPHPKGA